MESNDNIKIILKDNDNLKFKLDNKIEKVSPPLENLEINPSKEEQTFKSQNYYGYNNVTINPVTNSIDENIKSENIKKDVSILGVTGNVEEINTTEISINPTETEQVITPEAPYNGFSKVTVGAQSGIDQAEYFETTVTSTNINNFGINTLIKKTPNITIDQSVKNLQYLFQNAYYLKSINLIIDDNRELDCTSAFYNCANLTEVKGLEKTKITNAQNMFYNCNNLVHIPDIDTSLCRRFDYCFHNCTKLNSLPDTINTSEATSIRCMFDGCELLTNIPNMDTEKVTNMTQSFYNCYKLISVPLLNASNVMYVSTIFGGCDKLENLGGLKDLGKAYSTTSSANYFTYTLSLNSCNKLTHESLMNVINNLYDIATAGVQPQKLQLGSTNLAKLTDEEKAIATNKGWSIS